MKHLVLGSSGQIGNCIVDYFKNQGEEVIEFDLKVADITLNGKSINLLNVEKVGNVYLKNDKIPLKVSLPKPVRREGKFSELYVCLYVFSCFWRYKI